MRSPRRACTGLFDVRPTLVAARLDEIALRLEAFCPVALFFAVVLFAVAFFAGVVLFAGTVCLPIFPIPNRTPHPRLNLVTRLWKAR